MTTLSQNIATARAVRSYHRTLRALRALSDHNLKDLGLARGDLRRVARGVVRRA